MAADDEAEGIEAKEEEEANAMAVQENPATRNGADAVKEIPVPMPGNLPTDSHAPLRVAPSIALDRFLQR